MHLLQSGSAAAQNLPQVHQHMPFVNLSVCLQVKLLLSDLLCEQQAANDGHCSCQHADLLLQLGRAKGTVVEGIAKNKTHFKLVFNANNGA